MTDRKDLIALFMAETEEHLTNVDKGIVDLEKAPDNIEILDTLSRELHTIKGSARVFGYHEIEEISHKIEDVFGLIQQKRLIFDGSIADTIFRALDAIKVILKKIANEERIDIDISDIVKSLVQFSYKVAPGKETPEKGYKDGAAASDQHGSDKSTVKETQKKAVEKEAKKGSDEKKEPAEKREPITPGEYIRVPLSRVDKILNLVGELVINKMKSSQKIKRIKNISRLSKEIQKNISNLNEAIKSSSLAEDDTVNRLLSKSNADTQRMREDTLVLYDNITSEIFHLDPTIDELQINMKEMRMLPCSTIFETFPRMIRDIAVQENKLVNLEIYGEDTELDKKVLEGIKAPLLHILRNSVDHGIEGPDNRIALGKPKYGTIKLSAFHEAGNVVIVVKDDGAGMNAGKIRETALRKKLISEKDLEGMTEKDILNLVFINGFSTSPIITDVSGRGVGLDVVRRDIENLKGRITIDTEPDKGTEVSLVLPLTVAIVQVLLVKERGMFFAFPMGSIVETVKIGTKDIYTVNGSEAIQVRGKTLPVVRLQRVLGLPGTIMDGEETGKKKELNVVVGISLDKKVGFIVDEIVEENEVFIKSLGKHLGKVKNVGGATILGTGKVVVILDVADLITESNYAHPAVLDRKHPSKEKKTERKILVVEDALSTRELEKSILEAEGYTVDTAVDGMDAMERLGQNKYDLIVTDINMPRMDGFQFCETVKKDERFKDTPIIIVTSLEKEEEKRRGIRVGASAYIIKTSFDQTNLLDTIERLIG